MNNAIVRRAAAADAEPVAALIRRSFRDRDLALTIYGCHGIAEYLRKRFEALENGSPQPLVAECDGAVAGFVELRSNDSGVFLNYIATDERVQGRGLGRLLLKRSLEDLQAAPGTPFTLDVFGHNERAKSWYSRLGFEHTGSVGFWRARVEPAFRGAARFEIFDLPESDDCHETFGFSMLALAEADDRFNVGRIGSSWFRISDPRLLRKPEVLSGLMALDGERELLVNVAESEIEAGVGLELELLLRSDRMRTCLPLSL